MTAYYNENDSKAAEWLRQLIIEGLIAPGHVDERCIADVTPADLSGYEQHHFFAGIGGWSYALRLTGWPDDRPVWTGSCPCQPFSVAGNQQGVDDERHLWPIWRWLIDQRRPTVIFGEQVASKAGRCWLSGIRTDLETLGYGVGAADLCAAGIGSPHIRQRLWWVANTERNAAEQGRAANKSGESARTTPARTYVESGRRRMSGGMGNTLESRLERHTGHESDWNKPGRQPSQETGPATSPGGNSIWAGHYVPCADGKARRIEPGIEPLVNGISGRVGLLRGYGNAIVPQLAAAFVMAAADQTGETTK